MTNQPTVFDRALEQFKRDMHWSNSTGIEKTLVFGNLNGFTALLNKMLLETSDAEMLAAVSLEDLAEAHSIKMMAMKHAANHKAWAIGDRRSNGFFVRRIVWGKTMARAERRDGEQICSAVIMLKDTARTRTGRQSRGR